MSLAPLFPTTLLAFSLLVPAFSLAAPVEGNASMADSETEGFEALLKDLQEAEALPPAQRKDLERRLAEARLRLEEAKRQVVELEARLHEAAGQRSELWKSIASKPRLGVLLETDPDPEVDVRGVLVRGVSPGGPAAEAGLQAGDILTHLDGKPLFPGGGEAAVKKIAALLEGRKEGEEVRVDFLRGKVRRSATVRVRPLTPPSWSLDLQDLDLPDFPEPPEVPGKTIRIPKVRVIVEDRLPGDWYDVELAPLNPVLGRYFGTSEGLLVVNAPESNGLQVQAGDVIRKIGGRTPSTPAQAFRILRSYEPGERFVLELLRDRKPLEVEVTVPEPSSPRKEKGLRWEDRKTPSLRGARAPVAAAAAPPQAPAPPRP